MRWLRRVEHLLLVAGILLLGVYVGARLHAAFFSRLAIHRFESQHALPGEQRTGLDSLAKAPDFSLWSVKRIQDYRDSLMAHLAPAVALLRIPKIRLEVPVLEGTDDVTLNRGVGLIEGTARPGGEGNIGIAGHRDGFFRALKDIHEGDRIELTTSTQTDTYTIDRIVIVSPDDVSVLAPRPHPSVTLVTCYPFYYVGSAPQRYIVQASMDPSDPESARRTHAEARNALHADIRK